jgi:cytochrome c556
MCRHAQRLGAAGLLLALVAGDGGRAADLPRSISGATVLLRVEPDELTTYLHAVIQEEFKAPKPDEHVVVKLRATALLLVARAQNGRGARDLAQRTALRDNALRLQRALADGKIDVARRRAAQLFDVESTSATSRPMDLKGIMEQDEIEALFKRRGRGGLGLGLAPAGPPATDSVEMALLNWARKPPAAGQMDASAPLIQRAAAVTAAMADLIDVYAPEKKVGQKDPKLWKAAVVGMRASAQELEAAAKARDPARVRLAAQKVTANCAACHEVFRD